MIGPTPELLAEWRAESVECPVPISLDHKVVELVDAIVGLRAQQAASHALIMDLTERMERATSALLAGKVREDDLRGERDRDYADARRFQASFIEADQHLRSVREKLDEMTKRAARAEASVRFHSTCYPKAIVNGLTGATIPIHDPDAGCRMVQLANDIAEVIQQREDFSDRLDAAHRELAKLRSK